MRGARILLVQRAHGKRFSIAPCKHQRVFRTTFIKAMQLPDSQSHTNAGCDDCEHAEENELPVHDFEGLSRFLSFLSFLALSSFTFLRTTLSFWVSFALVSA